MLRTPAPLKGALDVSGLKVVPSWLTVTDIRLDKLRVGIAPSREFCWRVGHRRKSKGSLVDRAAGRLVAPDLDSLKVGGPPFKARSVARPSREARWALKGRMTLSSG